jgi:MoxR-like ATPase
VSNPSWRFTGGEPHPGIEQLPAAPSWRIFGNPAQTRGSTYRARKERIEGWANEVEVVNAALLLRRPLLITGKPGTGKSSLAYAVAEELQLGAVLRWSITTRSTLREGLYDYDAIGRLQDTNLRQFEQGQDGAGKAAPIGRYIRLGPLGTALLPRATPRVLLVDEIDKSDIDLPNDLLHVFEDGEYTIRELERLGATHEEQVQTWDGEEALISGGRVRCAEFPLVIFTSNGERDFPPAFLRRCLRLTVQPPGATQLRSIIESHFAEYLAQHPGDDLLARVEPLLTEFLTRREGADLATDQLLNAVYLVTQQVDPLRQTTLLDVILKGLNSR